MSYLPIGTPPSYDNFISQRGLLGDWIHLQEDRASRAVIFPVNHPLRVNQSMVHFPRISIDIRNPFFIVLGRIT
jgi:hypothetical protein